jgi:glycerol-3-phosphate dehydrogenase (NAD(P)+)
VLANLLASRGEEVMLWVRRPEVAREINASGHHPEQFPGHRLPPTLRATADLGEAVQERAVLVLAIPSQSMRSVLAAAERTAPGDALLVGASKGIEITSLKRMSEVAAETLPGRAYVALSGPSFAAEVLAGQPTAVVAAGPAEAAARVQVLFGNGSFRVYTRGDLVGTELAGAFKNVIAIAAGLCEGLGLGSNPRAALITRGLAEITRLGVASGAAPLTFAGLAGVGDLVLTSWGPLSRNRALGVALGRGEALEQYAARTRHALEGVPTARAALALAGHAGVELPISAKVAECLFDAKPPRQAISELMERTPKPEQWT